MNSVFTIEQQGSWRREELLAEAEAERIARRARSHSPGLLRARLAAGLYALADWLTTDTPGLADPQWRGSGAVSS